jgi:PAS domain S-box-containing protein
MESAVVLEMNEPAKRRLGVGTVAAFGVALLIVQGFAVYDDLVRDGDSLGVVLLEVAMPIALALSVLALAYWLAVEGWDGVATATVARWSAAGFLGMTFVAGIELGSQWVLGDDIEQWMVAASAAAATTLVGGIAGVERVRQKRQREELERNAARYQSLTEDVLDTSSVGTFILDEEFRVVWINEATEEYFGIDREEVVGRPKRDLIEGELAERFEGPERFRDLLFSAYDDNTYTEEFECHMLAGEDREDRWLEHWSKPIESGLYAGGRIEHYTDITEQKRTEEELGRREEQLREMNQVLSQADATFDEKLERLLGVCQTALDTEYAGIIRTSDRRADVEIIHAPADGVGPGTTIPLSDGVAEQMLSVRETIQGESASDRLPWGLAENEDAPEVGGYAATPVTADGDFYGVVCLFDTESREEPFAEWQLALLELTADLVGTEMARVRREQQRERELREQRQKFSALVEDVEEYAIFTLDRDGHVTSWNRGAERIKGYDKHEILDQHLRRFYPEEDRRADKPERLLDTAAEAGRVEDRGWRVRKNGERFWADVVISALTDDEGALRGYVKIVRDMTDQRERERRLSAVFNQTFQFVGLMNPDGRLIEVNERLLSFADFEEDAVVDEPLWDLEWWLSEADRERVEEAVETAADGTFVREEFDVQGADGVATIDFSISPVTDETGEVVLLVPEGRDITDRKQRERRLQVLYRVLRHNLRNEMTAIGGYADHLLTELEGDDLAEFARKIRDTAQEVGRLSDRVRDVEETIEDDREGSRRELVDLVGLVVERAVESYPEADVDTDIPAGINPRVDERLEAALDHVVENAIEHNDGEPTVRLRVERERTPAGEWLRITVDDNGPGIPTHERETIEEGTVTDLQHGSGLGLWVTKWVVESMGGELLFTDSDLDGTAVVVRIPEQGLE